MTSKWPRAHIVSGRRKRAAVAVLGYQTAIDLFGGFGSIGQMIKMCAGRRRRGKLSLTVIGVFRKARETGMMNPDEGVYVPSHRTTSYSTGALPRESRW